VSLASPGRRLLTVAANEQLGAYSLLRVADPDGPRPDPGQFAMLAASERWGGGWRTSGREPAGCASCGWGRGCWCWDHSAGGSPRRTKTVARC
jgi:hypothetical protein